MIPWQAKLAGGLGSLWARGPGLAWASGARAAGVDLSKPFEADKGYDLPLPPRRRGERRGSEMPWRAARPEDQRRRGRGREVRRALNCDGEKGWADVTDLAKWTG